MGRQWRPSGHSTYHAAVLKLDKRFSQGLTFTTSYVFSKMLTDADSYWITDQSRAADQYNRRLEKSIGSYDVTHNFKLGLTYELPLARVNAGQRVGLRIFWSADGASPASTCIRAVGPVGVSVAPVSASSAVVSHVRHHI